MSTVSNATRPPAIGDVAPDFELNDPTGRRHRLSDLRGAPVLLAFHPAHWDPSWAESLRAYNGLIANLPGIAGTRLLSIAGKGAWHAPRFDDGALELPVLWLDGGPVAARYGVLEGAAVFVIDADGRVAWRHIAGEPLSSPPNVPAAAVEPASEPPAEPIERDAVTMSEWTRRRFVATTLAAAVALAFARRMAWAEEADTAIPGNRPAGTANSVRLRVNGRDISLDLDPRVTLLDALREYAGITGPKKGCDLGQCGACTVHVNGRRILSCLTLAVMQQGKEITTIEGLAATAGGSGDALHPMQQAFIDHDGFQCGYCTSGQIMSAAAVVREPWGPSDDDVREAMSGNICRCGAYPGIVAAVQQVRKATSSDTNGARR
jgi:xanthine dehydrogenase YagT iron-sulfur-binding subunit